MTSVSFIVCSAGKCETRQQTLESINKLAFLEKEVFVCEKLHEPQVPPELAGKLDCSQLQNCLNLARGEYIRILEEGEVLESASLQEQIDRLKREEQAVCLLGLAPEAFRTSSLRLSGAYFLFLSLSNLSAPAKASSGLLFKNRKKAFLVDEKLDSLAISDLCFQLARHGDVIFQDFQVSEPVVFADVLREWMILARKYSSFLRCLGSGEDFLYQFLAKDCLDRFGFNHLLESKVIDENELLALRRVLFKEWDALSLLPEERQTLWLAACQVVGRNGALSKQQQLSRNYLVASKEVRIHEEKLRSLLMSRSWKYTKWLRDLHRTFLEEPTATGVDAGGDERVLSGAAYLHYLKTQINTIYASKSWFITSPLRAWESLGQLGDERSVI